MKRCKHGMIETQCSECSPNKVVEFQPYTTKFLNKENEVVRWKRWRTVVSYKGGL